MWILFSILAALAWSLVNIVDKFTITKIIKKPIVASILLGSVNFIISVIILIYNYASISWTQVLWFFIAAFCTTAGVILYYQSLRKEEASRVIPLFALTLIWIMIIAALYLGEIFGIKEYLGILIVFLGSVLISIKKEINYKASKALYIMLALSYLPSIK